MDFDVLDDIESQRIVAVTIDAERSHKQMSFS